MLASQTFTDADQIRFAAVSGDRNPMHLDSLLARRTQAGVPVVHGVHLLLWGLDALARAEADLPPMARLKGHFKRFAEVNQTVSVALTMRIETGARLDFVASGMTIAQLLINFGPASPAPEPSTGNDIPAPSVAHDLAFERMQGLSGRLAFASPAHAVAAMFPAACAWLGPRRVAAVAATTLLVGMVCPGLHSIYGWLIVNACEEPVAEDRLGFQVVSTEPRFRSVRMAIAGGGLAGMIDSYARMPPAPQASSHELAAMVEPGEFAGGAALVIGGSRGLGEVTAKLLAAGGAKVIISYRVGRDDAESVAREIRAAGGACEILVYDALRPAEPQLAGLADAPTHAYYFATPTIFRAQPSLLSRTRLDAFLEVYVDGFLNLAQALRARRADVSLFYPSSVYVVDRPRGMLEYAMAKAAGETLCGEMNSAWPPLRVTFDRLPRLRTDQTASVFTTSLPSPASCLLPLVRKVQMWPRPAENGAAPSDSVQTASAS